MRTPLKTQRLLLAVIVLSALPSCMTIRIEPSDKPMVVDLNVKVDHEIRTRVTEENQDLLTMEENYRKKKSAAKKKAKEE